jgi:hypothetical protein
MGRASTERTLRKPLLFDSKNNTRRADSALEVRSPRAVTGGPVARSPARGPGRAGIFLLRAGTGRPTKALRAAAARG